MTLLPLLLLANSLHPTTADVPYRQPQLATRDGVVAMTFGAGSTIYYSSSSDGGRNFAPPVKVADLGALALGRHRGPRVVLLKDSVLISAVVAQKVATAKHAHGLPDGGNLLAWRSADRGRTWKQVGTVNDVAASAREGLHAMSAGPDGTLFATWLDLRTPGMKLYGARSIDGGLTWSKNVQVYASPDGEICSCCHPSLAFDGNRIWVMWRNALAGNRDLYAAYSDDGEQFTPAEKQGTGTWKINACPMDGGGFVVSKGKVTSAWRRETEIFVVEPGAPERLLGPGKDVAITRTSRGAYLAWTRDGAIVTSTPDAREPQVLAPAGGFATLLALPSGGVIAAWESNGSIDTKKLN